MCAKYLVICTRLVIAPCFFISGIDAAAIAADSITITVGDCVQVKPAEELYGIIVVIGPEDDVISCCQYIEQQVGLLAQEQNHREKLRFSMTIDVDIQYQKKLIGKKGSRVSMCKTQSLSSYHTLRRFSVQNLFTVAIASEQ